MNRQTHSRTGKAGFTLIELLVVIAIIAILAAILFPVFTKVKNKAYSATCQSNLKQLALAVRAYCDDYDGYGPFTTCGSFWQWKLYYGGLAAKPWDGAGNVSALYNCKGAGQGKYGMNYYLGGNCKGPSSNTTPCTSSRVSWTYPCASRKP